VGLVRTYFGPLYDFLEFIGEFFMLLADALRRTFFNPIEWREVLNQMAFVGVASVPIVILTSFFSGAVISLYLSQFLLKFGASQFVGATVGLTATRELGPVITGITVAARCGSAMAAQIGTMAVTEQLDALEMLSVPPVRYLVVPRMLAGIIMLPVLGLMGIFSACFGGYLIAVAAGVPKGVFLSALQSYTTSSDLRDGLVKMPIFGLLIVLTACQQGLRTKGGAVGVGKATTNSVVISMVLVYMADYFVAKLQT
jgi:phospholipid/cholesterol/gamma-HCH transport system permease protein